MIRFILNNQQVQTDLSPGSTVLDFVRYHKRLSATKIGCREGDCGACTILAGSLENDRLVYRSMTSCLMPLGNANGKHIVTVEGINMPDEKNANGKNGTVLSPVQKAMVDCNGTQCGFCTSGFIMSLTGFVLDEHSSTYEDAIRSVDGNICRCTGYKSIERAAKIITEMVAEKPDASSVDWLVSQKFIPDYFKDIKTRLETIQTGDNEIVTGNTMMIAGGTDLLVQKHSLVKKSDTTHLFDTASLKGIYADNGRCYVNASTTVTAFSESPIIKAAFPKLREHIKLVSSTPIRNMATLAGNLVNASPIGDMTVFLLALDAEIVLSDGNQSRTIFLKDFYKGYKQLDKAPDEYIEQIQFILPQEHTHFSFEKVCKRTYLDIASVNSACSYQLNDDGIISDIHLSAGGVAPFPKYLAATASYLKGKRPDVIVLTEAIKIMNEEIAPISDARGTVDYKRLLLRQLFLAHFAGLADHRQILKQILLHRA